MPNPAKVSFSGLRAQLKNLGLPSVFRTRLTFIRSWIVKRRREYEDRIKVISQRRRREQVNYIPGRHKSLTGRSIRRDCRTTPLQ